MTNYPGAIDEFRTTQNLPGIFYDETDKTTVYAEDTNNHSAAIIAIEETLGTDPAGTFDTVDGRLDDIDTQLSTKQNALGFTPENAANKSTTTLLGASDTLYPSQKAVKTYVDTGLSTKQNSLGYTAENSANKATSTSLGTSNTLYPSQNAVKAYVDAAILAAKKALYPVGSIWTSTSVSTNPATVLGFGTWTAFAPGRVLAGYGPNPPYDVAGSEFGANTHTLTVNQIPAHSHYTQIRYMSGKAGNLTFPWLVTYDASSSVWSGVGQSNDTGGGQAHNIVQPTKVVYMWERTA